MAWCRLEGNFANHRKVKRLARRLGVSIAEARGYVVGIWCLCLSEAPDGDLRDFEPIDLADAACSTDEGEELVEALVSVGLLDRSDDGLLSVHEWMDRADSYREAKRKAARRRPVRSSLSGDSPGNVQDSPGNVQDSPGTVRGLSGGQERRGEERTGERDRHETQLEIASSQPDSCAADAASIFDEQDFSGDINKNPTTEADKIALVYWHWRCRHHKASPVPPQAARVLIKSRLRERRGDYIALLEAVDGCHTTTWNLDKKALTLKHCLRNDDTVTRHIETYRRAIDDAKSA